MSAIETFRRQASLNSWMGWSNSPVPETRRDAEPDELGRSPEQFGHGRQNDRFDVKLQGKLESFENLEMGWDGYNAAPPSIVSITNARRVLRLLSVAYLKPSSVSPSIVGGIGITIRSDVRKSYIECYNNGSIYLLLSDGLSEPFAGQADADNKLIIKIQEYLDATTAKASAPK